jgi:hypothetical protein
MLPEPLFARLSLAALWAERSRLDWFALSTWPTSAGLFPEFWSSLVVFGRLWSRLVIAGHLLSVPRQLGAAGGQQTLPGKKVKSGKETVKF